MLAEADTLRRIGQQAAQSGDLRLGIDGHERVQRGPPRILRKPPPVQNQGQWLLEFRQALRPGQFCASHDAFSSCRLQQLLGQAAGPCARGRWKFASAFLRPLLNRFG